MNTADERLGARVRKLRHDAKLTLEQLAERVGMSAPTLSRIERGEQPIHLEQVVAIAEALDTTSGRLLAAVTRKAG